MNVPINPGGGDQLSGATTPAQTQRDAAIQRLKDKRGVTVHLIIYLAINTMLVAVWFMSGGGFFWPVFVILGWGAGLAANAWAVFGQKPITEADIEQEMKRGGPADAI